MQCPFCHSPNPHAVKACRVCGGPLRAKTAPSAPAPEVPLSPVTQVAPMRVPQVRLSSQVPQTPTPDSPRARLPRLAPVPLVTAPLLLARRALASQTSLIVSASAGVGAGENQFVGLALEDGALHLWDLESDALAPVSSALTLRKPSAVCCAAWAPKLVARGHEDGKVSWHALEFQPKRGVWKARALGNPAPHLGRVLALAMTPTALYSGGSDGAILLADFCAERKLQSRTLLDGLGTMTTFARSPDERLLAVGGDDGAVRLWRVEAPDAPPRLDWTGHKHRAPVRTLAFSPNGQMLVSRAGDGQICLWAAQTSYPLPLAPGAQNSALAPAFSPDSRLLAVADAHQSVDIFEVAMGGLLHQLPPLGETVRQLTFSPAGDADTNADAARLIVAGARAIAVWEIK